MHQLDRIEDGVSKLLVLLPNNPDVMRRFEVRDGIDLLFRAILSDKKIEAIKMHRTLTGYGLKESKDEIERLYAHFAKEGAAI